MHTTPSVRFETPVGARSFEAQLIQNSSTGRTKTRTVRLRHSSVELDEPPTPPLPSISLQENLRSSSRKTPNDDRINTREDLQSRRQYSTLWYLAPMWGYVLGRYLSWGVDSCSALERRIAYPIVEFFAWVVDTMTDTDSFTPIFMAFVGAGLSLYVSIFFFIKPRVA